jgi:preprotein translocase subunit SecG
MYQAIIIIHVLLGLGIIGLVLMQQGKGADAGAAFGAGASGSVFGAQGAASFLSRTTAILATLFFATSLGLAVFNSHRGGPADIMSDTAGEKESLALPDVEGAKIDPTAPVVPQPVTEDAPVVTAPAETTTEQPAAKVPAAEVATKEAAPAAETKKEAPKKEAPKKEAAKK